MPARTARPTSPARSVNGRAARAPEGEDGHIAGHVPIMIGSDTGWEVMQGIAAPIVGGMVTGAPVIDVRGAWGVFAVRRRQLRKLPCPPAVREKVGYKA